MLAAQRMLPPVLGPVASSLGFEYAGDDYWWIPKAAFKGTSEKYRAG